MMRGRGLNLCCSRLRIAALRGGLTSMMLDDLAIQASGTSAAVISARSQFSNKFSCIARTRPSQA